MWRNLIFPSGLGVRCGEFSCVDFRGNSRRNLHVGEVLSQIRRISSCCWNNGISSLFVKYSLSSIQLFSTGAIFRMRMYVLTYVLYIHMNYIILYGRIWAKNIAYVCVCVCAWILKRDVFIYIKLIEWLLLTNFTGIVLKLFVCFESTFKLQRACTVYQYILVVFIKLKC